MVLKSAQKIVLISVAMLTMYCTGERRPQSSISYPLPLPDSVAMRFLPGIVCGDSLDFNAAFSPDGKSFYFSRSSRGKWMIYVTAQKEGVWTNPVPAPFNETEYSQADPFIASDGTLFYISNRPRHPGDTIADYDIWFIRPQKDGTWTKPENPPNVNSDSTEYYVSLSENGNLYFASDRAGTMGSHDIYVSRYINGAYTTPENLGPAINSKQMEHDPMISPDERFLIFTSVERPDSQGSADLYYSLRNPDGTWAPAKNVGNKVNTDSYEYCAYLTADKRYLFFSTRYDVKWISARHFAWMLH